VNDYFDVWATLCDNLKHPPPVSVRQSGISYHDMHRWLSFKHPPGFAATADQQYFNITRFKRVKQR